MCGIVGFLAKDSAHAAASGRIVLEMLEALARRGPDGAGFAGIGPAVDGHDQTVVIRIAGGELRVLRALDALGIVDQSGSGPRLEGGTIRLRFEPAQGVTAGQVETALSAAAGAPEVLAFGPRLELVKGVGPPRALEAAHAVSRFVGPVAIGHTRMSTESRIDLCHSQPFWIHGLPDHAIVHNGHITNYHRLRRAFEQEGARFHTENDSEVIGVFLKRSMDQGLDLIQAMERSVDELDGSFNYLVAAPEGLGVVRDPHGFKPLVLADAVEFTAVATEEIALEQALPGPFHAREPAPGSVLFFPAPKPAQSARDAGQRLRSTGT